MGFVFVKSALFFVFPTKICAATNISVSVTRAFLVNHIVSGFYTDIKYFALNILIFAPWLVCSYDCSDIGKISF